MKLITCKYCPGQECVELCFSSLYTFIAQFLVTGMDDFVIVVIIDIIMQLFIFFWWSIHEQNSADFHVEGSNVSKVYCFVINGIIVSKNCVEGSRNVCKGDGHLINVSWHWDLSVGSITSSIILVADKSFLTSLSLQHESFPL